MILVRSNKSVLSSETLILVILCLLCLAVVDVAAISSSNLRAASMLHSSEAPSLTPLLPNLTTTTSSSTSTSTSTTTTAGVPITSPPATVINTSSSATAATPLLTDKGGLPTPTKKDTPTVLTTQTTTTTTTTATDAKGNEEPHQDDQLKHKVESNAESKPEPVAHNDTCDGAITQCTDSNSLIACIKAVDDESKTLVLVIQNQGNVSLKVNITVPASDEQKVLEITEHKAQQNNVSLDSSAWNSVISLNAGNGDCILQLARPVSEGNIFKRLPPYSKLLTPIYGAYFLLLATVTAGGVWAWCTFRKRKRHVEIPYQELEMGIPESSVPVETAEGWDQGWDDDWDDNKAVRSPGARNVGSISANGLTSRSANRNGWEEWDD